jgi:hypothetical protein
MMPAPAMSHTFAPGSVQMPSNGFAFATIASPRLSANRVSNETSRPISWPAGFL